jgi:hypothetical protein
MQGKDASCAAPIRSDPEPGEGPVQQRPRQSAVSSKPFACVLKGSFTGVLTHICPMLPEINKLSGPAGSATVLPDA